MWPPRILTIERKVVEILGLRHGLHRSLQLLSTEAILGGVQIDGRQGVTAGHVMMGSRVVRIRRMVRIPPVGVHVMRLQLVLLLDSFPPGASC